MPLSNEALQAIKATGSAKFADTLAARVGKAYEQLVTRDTFGSAGYVPFMLGGIAAGQEWVASRLMQALASFGVRFNGKKYENSVKVQVTDLADDPAMAAARVAARMADTAARYDEKAVYGVLKSNSAGFDGEPLFGTHGTYSNDIEGTGAAWYIGNSQSIIVATREGEDFTFQAIGGTADSELTFAEDAVAMGWRARKIYAPGFYAHTVRSKAALTAENLQEAISRAHSFRNEAGEPIDNAPTHLVVPRALEAAATKLLKAMLVNGGDTNTDYNRLTLIVSDDL